MKHVIPTARTTEIQSKTPQASLGVGEWSIPGGGGGGVNERSLYLSHMSTARDPTDTGTIMADALDEEIERRAMLVGLINAHVAWVVAQCAPYRTVVCAMCIDRADWAKACSDASYDRWDDIPATYRSIFDDRLASEHGIHVVDHLARRSSRLNTPPEGFYEVSWD
jgi:hypothetical protein